MECIESNQFNFDWLADSVLHDVNDFTFGNCQNKTYYHVTHIELLYIFMVKLNISLLVANKIVFQIILIIKHIYAWV